tara:strand:+ start:538 stop:717 length:180 start_codon:yes stop_codon:yes gene_type:complete
MRKESKNFTAPQRGIDLETENKLLKRSMYDLQYELNHAYKRIRDLTGKDRDQLEFDFNA